VLLFFVVVAPLNSQKQDREKDSAQLQHIALPSTYRRIEVFQLSTSFRAATRIVSLPLEAQIPDGHLLVKNRFAGVNASDINFSKGRYFTGNSSLPFPAGFEAVGSVVAVGKGVDGEPPLASFLNNENVCCAAWSH
jgi:hypothetical protein